VYARTPSIHSISEWFIGGHIVARITLPQQRSQETRKRILDAASQVFSRRGYGQATVEEIAAEAGVSNGALYHHFASKEELFRAIVGEHLYEHKIELGAVFSVSSFRDAPGDRDKARELLTEAIAMYREIGMPKHVEMADALLEEA
jgi:AcrR family transcriptional regulator